jgi:hypothetical protein
MSVLEELACAEMVPVQACKRGVIEAALVYHACEWNTKVRTKKTGNQRCALKKQGSRGAQSKPGIKNALKLNVISKVHTKQTAIKRCAR